MPPHTGQPGYATTSSAYEYAARRGRKIYAIIVIEPKLQLDNLRSLDVTTTAGRTAAMMTTSPTTDMVDETHRGRGAWWDMRRRTMDTDADRRG